MSAFVSREFSLHAGDAHFNQRISKEAQKRRWPPILNKILITKGAGGGSPAGHYTLGRIAQKKENRAILRISRQKVHRHRRAT